MSDREFLYQAFDENPCEVNRLVLADYLEENPESPHDLKVSANLRKMTDSIPITILPDDPWDINPPIEPLIGKTLTEVIHGKDEITFSDGVNYWEMKHRQDCCEQVSIKVIHGDLDDLVGSPLLKAEELTTKEAISKIETDYERYSFTYTYYLFETAKGKVCVKWFGESNGYYGETPSIYHRGMTNAES